MMQVALFGEPLNIPGISEQQQMNLLIKYVEFYKCVVGSVERLDKDFYANATPYFNRFFPKIKGTLEGLTVRVFPGEDLKISYLYHVQEIYLGNDGTEMMGILRFVYSSSESNPEILPLGIRKYGNSIMTLEQEIAEEILQKEVARI